MQSQNRLLAAFLLVTAVSTSCAAATLNPKLAAGEIQIRKVCVMPVEAVMTKSGMKGAEGMARESETWAIQLGDVVTNHLKQSGAEITWGPSDAQKADEGVKQTVNEVANKYDTVATQFHKKAGDLKKSRFTLGDEVALLPCSAVADSLLFVHGQATVLTGGKKAFGTLVAGPSSSSASVRTTFVDSKSGEILAYTMVFAAGDKFHKDPEGQYGKKLGKEFKKMYVGGKPKGKK